MEQVSCAVVIVAGGSGQRMGSAIPKQFMFLDSKPILAHTINRFHSALPNSEIVVVLPEKQIHYWQNLASRFDIAPHRVVAGGKERYDSVKAALDALLEQGNGAELIAIHDGVRPLLSEELILRGVECAAKHGSAIPVVGINDSCRILDPQGTSSIINRSTLRLVQTPQIFDHRLLRRAFRNPIPESTTDDASLVERTGHTIHLIEGERANIKITTIEDLAIAEALLDLQRSKSEN